MSDQDRISPYNINTISSRRVMGIKKISTGGSLVDPILNSPKSYWNNCNADSKENC